MRNSFWTRGLNLPSVESAGHLSSASHKHGHKSVPPRSHLRVLLALQDREIPWLSIGGAKKHYLALLQVQWQRSKAICWLAFFQVDTETLWCLQFHMQQGLYKHMAVIYHSLDCGNCSFVQYLEQDRTAKSPEAKSWLSNGDSGNKQMRHITILTLKNCVAYVG